MRDRLIYLDYNATTPVDPRVSSAIFESMNEEFGNPSSDHAYGVSARAALERARSQIASLIGAMSSEVVFTGSGSEADALAIRGAYLSAHAEDRPHGHLITQVTEHPAVLSVCRELQALHDVEVTYLPVNQFGQVSPYDVEAAINSETFLVSIMHANNETGTIQPITEISKIAKTHGVLMHSDAAQSVGKVSVNVKDLGVDMLTVVGHKMYAPKGVAALYIRDGVHVQSIIGGGGQENGRRAGTENVAYAVGFGEAARLAQMYMEQGEQERLGSLRARLEKSLRDGLPGHIHVNGHSVDHLPNTLNFRIDGVSALSLLAAMPSIATSAGSACHAGRDEPSQVLLALGLEPVDALGAVRISLGRWSTENEIDEAAVQIISTAKALDPSLKP